MSGARPASQTRVGWGFDAHRLDGEPPLRLGGVVVSEEVGVSATSDGDVLAHAVIDALLGASVMGDLGTHFPSDEPEMTDADSIELLNQTMAKVVTAGWQVTHADVTVIAEHIRIAPYRQAIAARLAGSLRVGVDQISVKATSTDGLGFIGEGRGLAAVAVVSVEPQF